MIRYNVILVFDEKIEKLLMCRRIKEPFKGLSNLAGGKLELGENSIDGAYRELMEETGISREDIDLHHLMDFTYYFSDCLLEVYAGRLKHPVRIQGDENPLYWSDLNQNFFDGNLYAGEGNIGHMLEQVKRYKEKLFAGEYK